MKAYLNLMAEVMTSGQFKPSRPGVNTRSLFGRQLRIDLNEGFPLLTTKTVHWKSVVHELLWMISGSTNVYPLNKVGVTIWNEWANENGDLGPVYGKQWRDFDGVDQLANVMRNLVFDPHSRRHIVSAWNPKELPKMALAPCHMMFQFDVREVRGEDRLSCMMMQRSADLFLGVPFNIASYALLTHMMAHVTGLDVGELIINFGDVHIYENHFEQVALQLSRTPGKLPTLKLNPAQMSVSDFKYEDIELVDYNPQGVIKGDVAV